MPILWTGRGWLAAVIPCIVVLIPAYFTKGASYYNEACAAGLAVGGMLVFIYGLFMDTKPTRMMVNPKNNFSIPIKSAHTLYFIPVKYCGLIELCAGIALYFVAQR